MANPQLSYIPAPHEQPYYEGLFQAADTARGGQIGGAEAVQFFSRSKLAVETLKNIWTLSDQNPTSNFLDRRKFAIAIRLIQLAQNGVKAQGVNLGGPPGMHPAMFEGVSGVSVQLPPPEPAAGGPAPPQQHGPPPQQQPIWQQGPPPQQQQHGPPPSHPGMQPPSPQQQPQTPASVHAAAPPVSLSPTQTPTRPPISDAGGPPVMSMALTPQDPYTMTPQEQSRYEALFPNFEKDGFVHGKEAVELFSKSGVPQDQLAKIWNMVDTPVDNLLDKIEFAMAMHLIVCVSKKNLPLPSALPFSLKTLKSQHSAVTGVAPGSDMAPPMIERVNTQESAAAQSVSGMSSLGAGSAMGHHQEQQFSVPPPLPAPGSSGMSISDAFEGLSPAMPSVGYDRPLQTVEQSVPHLSPSPSYVHEPAPQVSATGMGFMGATASSMAVPPVVEKIPEPLSIPEPERQPAHAPAPIVAPPPSTKELASSYAMGDEAGELAKLKATLQKLQAENISLKAQIGGMSEEEREIHKETVATIAEINRLNAELTDVRAKVLSTKAHLLESTAELSALKEKKSVLTDLITETKATQHALEKADHDIHDANERMHTAPAPPPVPIAEADLFGDWGAPVPAAEAPTSWGGRHVNEAPQVETVGSTPSVQPEPGQVDYHRAHEDPTQQFGQKLSLYDDDLEDAAAAPAPVPFGGGGAYHAQPASAAYGASALRPGAFEHNPPPIAAAISRDEVESLKQSAMDADKNAREADETYRAISAETEKLRRIVEQAEIEARAKQDKAGKKRGLGKKKLAKEAEQAAIDAAEKKKHFLELQAQASNAQAHVLESKKEADQLRLRAEQAELDFASAESTRDSEPASVPISHYASASTPHQPYGQTYNPSAMQAPSNGGLPEPAALSQQSYPNYGIEPAKAAPVFNSYAYGNGAVPPYQQKLDDSFGFGTGIMGGSGGPDIPSPQANDGYTNPFY